MVWSFVVGCWIGAAVCVSVGLPLAVAFGWAAGVTVGVGLCQVARLKGGAAMNVYSGAQIFVVEPGTEVGKDAHGNPMIVSDEGAVFDAPCIWVTQKVYDKLNGGAA